MAPHSSTLAWKIPWTQEPGRLQSMESLRVGHDWATSLTFHFHALEKEMATHSSVLARRVPGTGSLVGCRLWGRKVRHDWSDLAEELMRKKYMNEVVNLGCFRSTWRIKCFHPSVYHEIVFLCIRFSKTLYFISCFSILGINSKYLLIN